jgi:uncharacterized membrane protein
VAPAIKGHFVEFSNMVQYSFVIGPLFLLARDFDLLDLSEVQLLQAYLDWHRKMQTPDSLPGIVYDPTTKMRVEERVGDPE